MVRVKKGLSSKFWEELVMAIVGEHFDVGNEICGAVLSVRFQVLPCFLFWPEPPSPLTNDAEGGHHFLVEP
jgi:hypothetical protein